MPAARGRRYLVSADTPITWRVFFEGYASELGRPGPKGQPRAVLERQNSNALKAVELLVRDPGRLFRPGPTRAFALWIPGKLGPILKRRMKHLYGLYRRVAPAPIYTPDAHQMAFYSAKCRVVIDRAKNELGYRPVYDFEKGMAMTGGWVRNALSLDS
jgi:nucleoside-diphosphate-sugar epimerase